MRWVFSFLILGVLGCGGKSDADAKHFQATIVPILEADFLGLLPGAKAVEWEQSVDRTEQDGLMPIPRTVGHSYVVLGKSGDIEVAFEGTYERSNRDLVFTTIRLTFNGNWNESEFPSNALAELGFVSEVVDGFLQHGIESSVEDSEGRNYSVNVMSSEGDGTTVHVTSFEVIVLDAKKR